VTIPQTSRFLVAAVLIIAALPLPRIASKTVLIS